MINTAFTIDTLSTEKKYYYSLKNLDQELRYITGLNPKKNPRHPIPSCGTQKSREALGVEKRFHKQHSWRLASLNQYYIKQFLILYKIRLHTIHIAWGINYECQETTV